MIVKTVQYWHRDKYIDKWNRIEKSEINSKINQFLTRIPRQLNGKRRVISTNDAGTTGHPHATEQSWASTSHQT